MSVVPDRERGFTLLEVLVAFSIAAVALAVMFSAVLGGMRAQRVAAHLEQATTLAQSRLAAATAALDARVVTGGDQEGDDGGGFHWLVRIAPQASVMMPRADQESGTRAEQATLYAIGVTVSWRGDGGRRAVHLDAARLETPPTAGS
jgi:general secretion pathway protein I